MKDHEAVTLKAFLVALTTQANPLPPDLQEQLNLLSENLLANLGKLDAIARQSSDLSAIYKSARQYFDPPSERNKGRRNLEDDLHEPSNVDELLLDNITPYDDSNVLKGYLKKVNELDDEKALQIAEEATRTDDSVKSVKKQLS